MTAPLADPLRHGFPGFRTGRTETDGASIAWREAGQGDAVLLIHGWPMTGYEWHHVAADLATDHRVVVPDYRGAGASSVPENGYDSATMARDLIAVLDDLDAVLVHIVGHDVGMQIATALALIAPDRVRSLTVMESMLPRMEAYDAFVATGMAWHFGFNAAADVATDLVDGRQSVFFEHFYRDFAARPDRIPQADRDLYSAAFAPRDRLRAGFRIYEAFQESGAFFADAMPKGGVGVPALVLCGAASTGPMVPAIARDIGATREKVMEDVRHFIPEEAPEELTAELRAFWKDVEREDQAA